MKNKEAISAVIGSTFFAVPYLALSIPIIPSVAIGAAAFCAGELLLDKEEKKTLKESNNALYQTLQSAKKQNNHILEMITTIEDEEIKKNLNEINDAVNKIIKTVEKSPKKVKNIDSFFDYYLPVTVKIIDRYDEIENQNLSSADSKKFIKSTNKMVSDINLAFKKILNNLYQSEIIDTDAEMKVFNSMLKSEGFSDNELDSLNKEE